MELSEYLQEHQDSFNETANSLYQRLTASGIKIDFEIKSDQDTWGMLESKDGKKFTITDPGKGPNPSAMIHELLHIDLAQKGFKSDDKIAEHFAGNTSFFGSSIGGRVNAEINNKLAHLRMIKVFLKLKFDPNTFLQESPSAYFDAAVKKDLTCMEKLKEAGVENTGMKIFNFIYFIGSLKLFSQYPETDISGQILQSLKSIDADLFEKIEKIYDQWILSENFNNLLFYENIDKLLKEYNVPPDFSPEYNSIEEALCQEPQDILDGFKKAN